MSDPLARDHAQRLGGANSRTAGAALPPAPRWLNNTLLFLAWFMVAWVFLMPATWLIGLVPGYEFFISKLEASLPPGPFPDSVTRYSQHDIVRFTHNLPAGLWSLLIPINLSQNIRLRRPTLHRWSGRVLLALSALVLVGYGFVLQRRLSTVHEAAFNSPLAFVSSLALHITAIWFLITGIFALQTARRSRFRSHRAWSLRHIAGGLCFSLLRVLLVPMTLLPQLGIPVFHTHIGKVEGFCVSALVSWTTCVVACEVALYQQRLAASAKTAKAAKEL